MRVIHVRTFCFKLFAATVIALGGVGVFGSAPAAPVPAAKPTDAHPIDPVEVGDLSALLRAHSVGKDLGLTAEQNRKLSGARAKARDEVQKNFTRELQNLPPVVLPGGLGIPVDQAIPVLDAIRLKAIQGFGREATAVLKPEQMRRLKQIRFQANGPAALVDRLAIRALELTADQENKIGAVISHAAIGVIVPEVGVRVEADPKAVEKLDAAWAAALKVLTPEQRAKWDALIGKRLPTADLHQIHSSSLPDNRFNHSNLEEPLP